jgi:hypothetical protein
MITAIAILLGLLAVYAFYAVALSLFRVAFLDYQLDPVTFPALLKTAAIALGFLGLLLK